MNEDPISAKAKQEAPGPHQVEVQIRKSAQAADLPYPAYATPGSSGVDLRAANIEPITLKAGEITLVPTGISIALPFGTEAQVRARSGLALKHGITLVNAPGTIDADYRGEIGVIMTTLANEPFLIRRGERIAQLVFAPVYHAQFREVDTLPATQRGSGGFGHTGV